MVVVNPTDSTGFVQPVQPVQSEQSANPGFTQQAPTQANIPPPQTFYPSSTSAPTTYGAPTAYASPSFVSPPSLAPTGAGLPRDSTSYDVGSPGSGGSDFPWGPVAGGAGLAALLAAQDDDGSGLSFDNILSGAEKLFNLGDMGTGVEEMLGKFRDAGFDDIANSIDSVMGVDSRFMPGSKAGEAFQLGPTEGIPEFPMPDSTGGPLYDPYMEQFSNVGTPAPPVEPSLPPQLQPPTAPPALPAPTTATGAFSGSGPIFSASGVAGMFPGAAANTAALMASPGFASTMPAALQTATSQISLLPSMGGALAGTSPAIGTGLMFGPTAGAAPAGGLAAMGAMGPMMLAGAAFMAIKAMKEPVDPTAEPRMLNQWENMLQPGGKNHPITKHYGEGIEGLEQLVYDDINALQLIKDATSGSGRAEPFGTPHTSGGTKKISWSPAVAKKVQENMSRLEAASAAGQAADPAGEEGLYKPKKYAEVKSGATFNSGNDPYGHREREAAAHKAEGYGDYIPSGRDLQALLRQTNDGGAGTGDGF